MSIQDFRSPEELAADFRGAHPHPIHQRVTERDDPLADEEAKLCFPEQVMVAMGQRAGNKAVAATEFFDRVVDGKSRGSWCPVQCGRCSMEFLVSMESVKIVDLPKCEVTGVLDERNLALSTAVEYDMSAMFDAARTSPTFQDQ